MDYLSLCCRGSRHTSAQITGRAATIDTMPARARVMRLGNCILRYVSLGVCPQKFQKNIFSLKKPSSQVRIPLGIAILELKLFD